MNTSEQKYYSSALLTIKNCFSLFLKIICLTWLTSWLLSFLSLNILKDSLVHGCSFIFPSIDSRFSGYITTTTLCPSPIPIALTVPRAAHNHHLPLPQIRMTNSTGRFRVGKVLNDPGASSLQLPPIEKRFKRGRWDCKDWYDHDLGAQKKQAKAPLAMWNDSKLTEITRGFSAVANSAFAEG